MVLYFAKNTALFDSKRSYILKNALKGQKKRKIQMFFGDVEIFAFHFEMKHGESEVVCLCGLRLLFLGGLHDL